MKKVSLINPIILAAISIFLAINCKKNDTATIPVISTTSITDLTGTTATIAVYIMSDGGSKITARGICWSTIENPTTADSKTFDGDGTGQFISSLSGLTAGTTYHARAYATNSAGTSFSNDLSFSTPGKKPTCSTQSATNISMTGATLNGTVNANDLSTAITFEYGTTTSYGSTLTVSQFSEPVDSVINVSAEISDLGSGLTCHFRIRADNPLGSDIGNDMIFTTLAGEQAPIILTEATTNISQTGSTLTGMVDANGLSTTVTFEYGITTSYGNIATASQSPLTGDSITNVSTAISGLLWAWTYHFRIKAENSDGTVYGNDVVFITDLCMQAPIVSTMEATNLTTTGATLNGTVNAKGLPTTVSFTYSYMRGTLTVTAQQSPVTGDSITLVTANISGLRSGTAHTFHVQATNSCGTSTGSVKSFTLH